MSFLIILQARLASSRLPKKVLKPLLGKPLLHYTLERLKALKSLSELVVATTETPLDDAIASYCETQKVDVFRGSEGNVLERFYECALKYSADYIVRVTGDCPLVDIDLLKKMLLFYSKNSSKYDYISNVLERSYPKGLDLEIFSFKTLKKAYFNAQNSYQKEHVTPYIYQNREIFYLYNFKDEEDFSHINVSVDTQSDFDFVEKIIQKYYAKNPYFGLKEIKQFSLLNLGILDEKKPLSIYT